MNRHRDDQHDAVWPYIIGGAALLLGDVLVAAVAIAWLLR